MLMNNIGEHVHRQVTDTGLLPILVKIVKKKSDSPVREKIFLLLDATQTSLGGASGKFPQYYSAYHDLVNAGVQFPQRPRAIPSSPPTSTASNNNVPGGEPSPSRPERPSDREEPRAVPESSIIQKAGSALEVLREVLDAVDTQHPEGAKDEFTLDLVEQCSFQKQRVVHLAMSSRAYISGKKEWESVDWGKSSRERETEALVVGIWNLEEGSPPQASPLQEPNFQENHLCELLESPSERALVAPDK
ncbi:ENTH/VHS/GAT family protein [Actinidia rufa]|uniref:ENTH/VHS/GAT family protein n=1 Tax=Actinidia rufa TaxID=165716 RepID=A0A7J0H7I6_9ERIC|nr:ENTH/VHS/GAT family protein [Actinidia rufa]